MIFRVTIFIVSDVDLLRSPQWLLWVKWLWFLFRQF